MHCREYGLLVVDEEKMGSFVFYQLFSQDQAELASLFSSSMLPSFPRCNVKQLSAYSDGFSITLTNLMLVLAG